MEARNREYVEYVEYTYNKTRNNVYAKIKWVTVCYSLLKYHYKNCLSCRCENKYSVFEHLSNLPCR